MAWRSLKTWHVMNQTGVTLIAWRNYTLRSKAVRCS